jgi:alkylhydroperoxidase family enzyme
MPNLGPLADDQADDAAREAFAALRARLGLVPNMYRTLGHAPQVLDAVIGMGKAIRVDLDTKLRELAYLKAAQLHNCHY